MDGFCLHELSANPSMAAQDCGWGSVFSFKRAADFLPTEKDAREKTAEAPWKRASFQGLLISMGYFKLRESPPVLAPPPLCFQQQCLLVVAQQPCLFSITSSPTLSSPKNSFYAPWKGIYKTQLLEGILRCNLVHVDRRKAHGMASKAYFNRMEALKCMPCSRKSDFDRSPHHHPPTTLSWRWS